MPSTIKPTAGCVGWRRRPHNHRRGIHIDSVAIGSTSRKSFRPRHGPWRMIQLDGVRPANSPPNRASSTRCLMSSDKRIVRGLAAASDSKDPDFGSRSARRWPAAADSASQGRRAFGRKRRAAGRTRALDSVSLSIILFVPVVLRGGIHLHAHAADWDEETVVFSIYRQ